MNCRAHGSVTTACSVIEITLQTQRLLAACLAGIIAASMLAGTSAATYAATPNDPFANSSGSWEQDYADQWSLHQQRIYADVAPAQTPEPIIVAIIDTGLDYTHVDFAGEKLWRNPGETANGRDDDKNGYVDDLIGWNWVEKNNQPWDDSGHGTHVAGLIAACTNNGIGIAGVNPHAKIMPLKVANFIGQARSSSVAAAIYYAVDHGARIINISLGGELISDLEREAARYAYERDVLIIVAAGNKGMAADKQGSYATLPHALVVGAADTQGQRAGFSNFGPAVALVAPGVEILSLRARDTDFIALSEPLDYTDEAAVVGEDEAYYRASGTSFATALTTGVASRIIGLHPNLDAQGLKNKLIQSAQDIDPPGIDQLTGFGQLDYLSAYGSDPAKQIEARLTDAKLELREAQIWIDLRGRAIAQQFQNAVVEIRRNPASIPTEPAQEEAGKKSRKKKSKKKKRKSKDDKDNIDPLAWQTLAELNAPIKDATLTEFSLIHARQITQSTNWEIRLTVSDKQGSQRVTTLKLALPTPTVEVASNE